MLEYITSLVAGSERTGLLIVFIILVACGLGLPVPEDISIIAAGILVSAKATNFATAFIVCLTGILIGDSTIYWMGRLLGRRLFKLPVLSRIFNSKFMSHGKTALNKYGNKIIFFARFLPGLRAPIYFFSGTMRVSFTLFLVFDFLAALISVPVWIYLGKIFGENLDFIEKVIKSYKLGAILLILFFVVILIIDHLWRKKLTDIIEK
ncbi:MAG: DedA family protein [Pseudomonadota bacterium]